jgi:hypothetical protein
VSSPHDLEADHAGQRARVQMVAASPATEASATHTA